MTLDFGTPIVGWTYLAENWAPEPLIQHLIVSEDGFADWVALASLNFAPANTVIETWLSRNRIDIQDQSSYDSDDWPKPIAPEQLACTDREWTPLAPDHSFTPWAAPLEDQTCTWCGERRLRTTQQIGE